MATIHQEKTRRVYFAIAGMIPVALAYGIFYLMIQAHFAAVVTASYVFGIFPIVVFLLLKNKINLGQFILVIGSNLYLFGLSIAFDHQVGIEYYFFPAMLASLLVFDTHQVLGNGVSMGLPFALWLLMDFTSVKLLPESWVNLDIPLHRIKVINSYVAYGLELFFTGIFLRSFINIQNLSISQSKWSVLGEMAGGIAHEINNPLAIILGRLDRLKAKVSNQESSESLLTEINKLKLTVNRITLIVKGLKSFSRNSELDSNENVSVHQLITETCELCHEKLKNNNIDLILDLSVNYSLSCKRSQISQVLLSLLMNSSDAVEKKSQAWIKISTHIHRKSFEIRVTDSGNGIPPEVVSKMMQPFFTTKEVGKGTGLGLSISKGIMESHGGVLEYDSKSPETCFVLTFPLEEKRILPLEKKAG